MLNFVFILLAFSFIHLWSTLLQNDVIYVWLKINERVKNSKSELANTDSILSVQSQKKIYKSELINTAIT